MRTYISEDVVIYQRQLNTCGKIGRNILPHLAFQHYPSGHRDMERPKQKWQDQERLQDQEEKMLVNLNRSSQDDDNDDSNVNMRTGITFCNFAVMCISAFVHSFRSLSYDRFMAPSKTSSPQSAI